MINTVQPFKITDLQETDLIIDVRTKPEHDEIRLACEHILIPLDQLEAEKFIEENNISNDTKIYILCRIGRRAVTAAEKFNSAGFYNVYVIEGGIENCVQYGIETKANAA